jgi:hypothetical protein
MDRVAVEIGDQAFPITGVGPCGKGLQQETEVARGGIDNPPDERLGKSGYGRCGQRIGGYRVRDWT